MNTGYFRRPVWSIDWSA